MEGYVIITNRHFERKYKALLKKNEKISAAVLKAFLILRNNPFDKRLRTHLVVSRHFGRKYASRVANDLRLIWDFDEGKIRILLVLDIGGHSGNSGVYND